MLNRYRVHIKAPAIIRQSYYINANNITEAEELGLQQFNKEGDVVRGSTKMDVYFDEKSIELIENKGEVKDL